MEHIVYLDNSSTTKPCKAAIDGVNRAMTDCWGNPSSLHRIGLEAELAVNGARETVAKSLHCRADEIIFTGSGTEANNTALMSVLANHRRGKRIITTAIEHPSVLETAKRLETMGYEVIRLKPDHSGKILLEDLKNALNGDTLLVSIMLVNNEVGSIQPISEAAALIKKYAPSALFHCDAVQGYGKLPINASRLGVDMLSASGHKIHGPKGIGFLYCKKGVHISPFITGGGQERGLRSGTESVPLICGLKGAVDELSDISLCLKNQQKLYDYTKSRLSELGFIKINSQDGGLPYIMNISVPGYRSETLLHFLESRGIFVSSGSACSKGHISYVLKEVGLTPKLIDSALRLSFSRYNTQEDIELLCSALKDAVTKLRKA